MEEGPRFRRKHVIELSEDEDEGYGSYDASRHHRKRAKFDDASDKDTKGKGAANEPRAGCSGGGGGASKPRTSEQKKHDASYFLDANGHVVVADSPPKPKARHGPSRAEGGAGDVADASRAGYSGHQPSAPQGQVASHAFAGGSSRAAQLAAVDPLDEAVATVCAIVPDVVPTHVRDLLRRHGGNVELVVDSLLADANYPKRQDDKHAPNAANALGDDRNQPEGDLEDVEDDSVQKEGKVWLDVKNRKPGGRDYEAAALAQLYIDFPSIQQANLKRFFSDHFNFYAPTYFAAEKALAQTEEERGFKLMASERSRVSKGKGKRDDGFEIERKWVREQSALYKDAELREQQIAKQHEAEIAAGNFFECGCCFSETAFSQIIICSEGCQFCKDCSLMNAESQIGMRKYILPCMSTSGCQATFPDSEIVKFLPRKSREALHKIRQEKEIDLAGLDFLEKCPFCPFAYIIENEQERLFHCQRPECQVVSCRQCKKQDHLPKTCQEVSDDAKINAVHQVEEAMSSALIRKCPKCSEPYIKENDSCNKITCGSCRTMSCYICSKIITSYSHFANAGSNAPQGSETGATCPLWDDTSSRNYQEVEAARIAAESAARGAAVPDADLDRLKADAPKPVPARLAHLPPPVVPAYRAIEVNPARVQARAQPPPPAVAIPQRRIAIERHERAQAPAKRVAPDPREARRKRTQGKT